jgi:hypothetical protein
MNAKHTHVQDTKQHAWILSLYIFLNDVLEKRRWKRAWSKVFVELAVRGQQQPFLKFTEITGKDSQKTWTPMHGYSLNYSKNVRENRFLQKFVHQCYCSLECWNAHTRTHQILALIVPDWCAAHATRECLTEHWKELANWKMWLFSAASALLPQKASSKIMHGKWNIEALTVNIVH